MTSEYESYWSGPVLIKKDLPFYKSSLFKNKIIQLHIQYLKNDKVHIHFDHDGYGLSENV